MAVDAAGRRVRLVVPKRGEKRGLLDLAARNAELAYQPRFNENVAANYDALETLRAVLALPAVPRRIECFDISTIQGSETVASMVVCEDGRMRKGSIGSSGFGARRSGLGRLGGSALPPSGSADASAESRAPDATPSPGSSTTSPPCTKSSCAATGACSRPGGRFPDLILIDGGKGQLSAAYAALEELGLGNLVAVGIAKKEELLFTRDPRRPIALARTTARRCC